MGREEFALDNEKFVAHFVRHQSAIHSFIMTIVPSSVDSDEILQEASMTMWKKFDQFQEGTNFRNWAFQIAKFTAMNHVRKAQRDRHLFGTKLMELLAKEVEQQSEQLESRRLALRHCKEKLPSKDLELLNGCYTENMNVIGYAKTVERTPNAVYKQLNRIRRDLLRCIQRVRGSLPAVP